jgi:3',5'-cyclic AMP phosphodiesterase CpdA
VFTVAQITDLHVTTDKDALNQQRNEARLRQTLASILDLKPRPVAVIATGDLVDRGDRDEYLNLKAILDGFEIPVHLGVGNHDLREPLREVFPDERVQLDKNGFVQYAIEYDRHRIVMCDTLEPGQAGGGFCRKRAAWLDKTLSKRARTPTLIGLHHPPISSGIRWMDEDPKIKWVKRLADVLRKHPQVRAVTSGHMHRPYSRLFGRTLATVAPATSIQLTLNLTDVDMRVPDGREILLEEPPGFLLHMFEGSEITGHVCLAGPWPSAVSYQYPFQKA